MPRVEIIGVYPLRVTDELVGEAMQTKWSHLKDSASRKKAAEELRNHELGSVVLVEAIVHGADEQFDVGAFGQSKKGGADLGSNDQVAYDEVFLSDDGTAVLTDAPAQPVNHKLRLAFWLHYYEPTKPMLTCYGSVQAPEPSVMPDRLSKLIRYEPVD